MGVPLFLSCIILVVSWLTFQVSEAQLLYSGPVNEFKRSSLLFSRVFLLFFFFSEIRPAGSRGATYHASGVDSENTNSAIPCRAVIGQTTSHVQLCTVLMLATTMRLYATVRRGT